MTGGKRARSWISAHERYPESTQTAAAIGKKYTESKDVSLDDFIRALREDEIAAVWLAYLFAPKRKLKGADKHKTWWRKWREIEKRCAYVLELKTGLRSDNREQRDQIIETALEMVRKGGRADAARKNGALSKGRPIAEFDDATKAKAEALWFDRRLSWRQVQEKLPKGVSANRCYRWFGKRT
jgi:hypothetical protein